MSLRERLRRLRSVLFPESRADRSPDAARATIEQDDTNTALLFAQITPNRYSEISTGPEIGRERVHW
jgi:hypothetical protein